MTFSISFLPRKEKKNQFSKGEWLSVSFNSPNLCAPMGNAIFIFEGKNVRFVIGSLSSRAAGFLIADFQLDPAVQDSRA